MLSDESFRKLSIWGGALLVAAALLGLVAQDLSLSLGRRRAFFTKQTLEVVGRALSALGKARGAEPAIPGAEGGMEWLEPHLVPAYLANLPREDGWGRPFRVGRPDPSRFEDPRTQAVVRRGPHGSSLVVWSRGPDGRDDRSWLGGITFEFRPGGRVNVWRHPTDDLVLLGGQVFQGPTVSESEPVYATDPVARFWLRYRLPPVPALSPAALRPPRPLLPPRGGVLGGQEQGVARVPGG